MLVFCLTINHVEINHDSNEICRKKHEYLNMNLNIIRAIQRLPVSTQNELTLYDRLMFLYLVMHVYS